VRVLSNFEANLPVAMYFSSVVFCFALFYVFVAGSMETEEAGEVTETEKSKKACAAIGTRISRSSGFIPAGSTASCG